MPAFMHDDVYDAALGVLDGATNLYICSGTPADRAAVLAASLATIALDAGDYALANGTPDGRGLTVAAQNGVAVTASGTPAHYCLIDGTRLLARAEINPSSPNLTTGSTVDIPATTFEIGDAVTEV